MNVYIYIYINMRKILLKKELYKIYIYIYKKFLTINKGKYYIIFTDK